MYFRTWLFDAFYLLLSYVEHKNFPKAWRKNEQNWFTCIWIKILRDLVLKTNDVVNVWAFIFFEIWILAAWICKRISFKNIWRTKLDPVSLTYQKQCIKLSGKDPLFVVLLLIRTADNWRVKCTMSNNHDERMNCNEYDIWLKIHHINKYFTKYN